MALNPQQEETEVVCLQASGASHGFFYLTALRGLSNPGSGIWLQREELGLSGTGEGGAEQRVTAILSECNFFFFF